jgi:hypothetical protein
MPHLLVFETEQTVRWSRAFLREDSQRDTGNIVETDKAFVLGSMLSAVGL